MTPIFFTPEPPGNDFTSHLATGWLARDGLAGGGLASGPWAAGYRFELLPLPYWLATLLLAPLIAAFGAQLGQQLLLAGLVLALPASLRAVERARGRRPSPIASAAALLASFSWAWWLGELSFLLGVPCALWAFAAWLRLADGARAPGSAARGGRAWAAFSGWTLATYLAHIYALCALLAALGASLAVALLQRQGVTRRAWGALAVPLGLFVLGAGLIFAGPGAEGHGGRLVFDLGLWRLADSFGLPFALTVGPAWAPALFPLALLGLSALDRAAPRDPWLLAAGGGLWALAWLGPMGLEVHADLEDIGRRFSPWAVLLLLAGAGAPQARRLRQASLAVVIVFGGLRVADAWRAHLAHRDRAAAVGAVLAQVPAGARVVPLMRLSDPRPADYWLHRSINRVVYERAAYSPHVFARAGQQPLRHVRGGDHREVTQLELSAEDWAFFDHALVQVSPEAPPWPPLVARARRVAEGGGFRLYRW